MLGKCLWKMHSCGDDVRGKAQPPDVQYALDAFAHAIECLPGRKDSRQDPILEPHYKLVSVVHKLVQRRQLQVGYTLVMYDTLLTMYCSPKEAVMPSKLLLIHARCQSSTMRRIGKNISCWY